MWYGINAFMNYYMTVSHIGPAIFASFQMTPIQPNIPIAQQQLLAATQSATIIGNDALAVLLITASTPGQC